MSRTAQGVVQTATVTETDLKTSTYVREKYNAALELEKQLVALTGNGNNNSTGGGGSSSSTSALDKANQIRLPLCEILADILLEDPNFAFRMDIVGRLWRNCFYSRIVPLRSRIWKEKKRLTQFQQQQPQKQPSASTLRQTETSIMKLEKHLNVFLSEAVTLHVYLTERLCNILILHRQHQASNNGTKDKNSGRGKTLFNPKKDNNTMSQSSTCTSRASQTPNSQGSRSSNGGSGTIAPKTTTAGVVECLHRIAIHLGDLYRYSSNLGKAESAYLQAAALGPGYGHAYNQLAVVCQVKDQNNESPLSCVAFYWYARSLVTTQEPFETSCANLAKLLNDNRNWLQQQLQQQQSSQTVAGASGGDYPFHKSVQSRLFLANFVDFHYNFFLHGIYSNTKEDAPTGLVLQVVQKMDSMMELFQQVLQLSALGDSLLCKLVTIQAFSEFQLYYKMLRDASTSTLIPGHSESVNNMFALAEEDQKAFLSSRILTQSDLVTQLAQTACMSLFIMGQKLADRVLLGLAKSQLQSNNSGSKKESLPSVRLLVPLLLLTDYIVESSPCMGASRTGDQVIPELRNRYETEEDEFWKRIIAIHNCLLQLYRGATASKQDLVDLLENADADKKNKKEPQLKEYSNLRGFKPFQRFLKEMTNTGYASDDEAIEILHSPSSQTQESSTSSRQALSSQNGNNKNNNETASSAGSKSTKSADDPNRAKVTQFLQLAYRLASNPHTSRIQRQAPTSKNSDDFGKLIWVEELSHVVATPHSVKDSNATKDGATDMDWVSSTKATGLKEGDADAKPICSNLDEDDRDDDDVLVFDETTEHDDVEANAVGKEDDVVMETKEVEEGDGKDVGKDTNSMLVYQQGAAGGPALLVPGALLQNLAKSRPSVVNDPSPAAPVGHEKKPSAVLSPADILATSLNAATAGSTHETTPMDGGGPAPWVADATSASKVMESKAAPSLRPPPGFGSSIPQPKEHPMDFSNPSTTGLSPSIQIHGNVPSSTMDLAFVQQQQATVGRTYSLFGGLGTANPFASIAAPNNVQPALGGNQFNVEGRLGAANGFSNQLSSLPFLSARQGEQGLFIENEDAMRSDGAGLLDSSLLQSLFMDENGNTNSQNHETYRVTNNPFATT